MICVILLINRRALRLITIHYWMLSHWGRDKMAAFSQTTFTCIFLNENDWISLKISLKFVPKGPINNIPALVQIMAWCRPGDKPLSGPMVVSLLTHICVTRPQWVILTSNRKIIAGSLNVNTGINDFHDLVAFSFKMHVPKTANRNIQYRSYKHFDDELFEHNIASAPYHVGDIFDSFDERCLCYFLWLFYNCGSRNW